MMEKPKITQGEWGYKELHDKSVRVGVYLDEEDRFKVHNIAVLLPEGHSKANARLFSASKDMMNDLIDAYEKLLNLKLTHGHLVNQKQIEKMESTLRKAGVKFETEKAIQ